ncbi:MAG: hypothetical protein ABFS46_00600 [Myxococcota bacterium]
MLIGLACAQDVVLEGGRFVHRRLGYTIEQPGGQWSALPVEGADLAFRGPGNATLSLSSRCRTSVAAPRVLARHLVIGVPDRSPLEGSAVEVDGGEGWFQRTLVRLDEQSRWLDSVTTVRGDCVLDFLLLAPVDSPELQAEFSGWWQSFRWPAEGEAP